MQPVLEKDPGIADADADYWRRIYDMKPATITVTRTDPSDVQQRQLVVSLDGKRVGELLFGESLTHEVLPGPHRLRVSNTLVWKTIVFEAKAGESIRFEAINHAGKLTYPMMVVMGVGPLYVTLRRVA